MQIDVSYQSDVATVTVIADHLDFQNVADFRSAMAPVLEKTSRVVVNLEHLRFIDSSGLGAILSFLRNVSDKRGDLRLSSVDPAVAAILQLVRMDQILDVYDTSDEAVRSFD